MKAPDTINIENLVADNVGAFLSGDSPHWLMTLGTSLNLFAFWNIALMGVGFSAASPKKVSIGKGIAIVAISGRFHPRQSRMGRRILLMRSRS